MLAGTLGLGWIGGIPIIAGHAAFTSLSLGFTGSAS
jgi:hypothetical protein